MSVLWNQKVKHICALRINTAYKCKETMAGNECGKNKSNENFKTAIRSNNYDRSKTVAECGMF